jgi:hypothetical protein
LRTERNPPKSGRIDRIHFAEGTLKITPAYESHIVSNLGHWRISGYKQLAGAAEPSGSNPRRTSREVNAPTPTSRAANNLSINSKAQTSRARFTFGRKSTY